MLLGDLAQHVALRASDLEDQAAFERPAGALREDVPPSATVTEHLLAGEGDVVKSGEPLSEYVSGGGHRLGPFARVML
jgi:hypothetical protein